jgi:16S rRNA (cytosine967-C5)-methyltransferase
MTPQARVQAAIELLDEIIVAAKGAGAAADTLIARYFASRRYAGSKDRRAVRELVYRAVRRAGDLPVSGRAAMLGLAADDPELKGWFDGSPHGPSLALEDEPIARCGAAPAWLAEKLSSSFNPEEMATFLDRAPFAVRVNRLKVVRSVLLTELTGAEVTPLAPDGLILPEGTQVKGLDSWRTGLIEVQDEGSQLTSLAAGASARMIVIDLCAGAGGKTLALAAEMQNEGRIVACDVDRTRLSRLAPRAERAGVTIAETRLLNPGREADVLNDLTDKADLVVIDAPCSGTGTWRRNPEARWRLTPTRLARLIQTQAHLIELGATLVRPGGKLHYIVCSLLDGEGREQVDAFLDRHQDWRSIAHEQSFGHPWGAGYRLDPYHYGTDGFFFATLQRHARN